MIRMFKFLTVCMLSLAGFSTAYAGGLLNVAAGKPITPLTNTQQGNPVWVTDGTIDTGAWYSYQYSGYNTNSFTIDLGAQYAINSVNIHVSQIFGYELSSSDNGSDWTPRNAADLGNNTYGALSPLPGGYSARYLKYWAYANWNQYVGIVEFQVCTVNDGEDTTTCSLVPTYSVGGNVSGLSADGLALQNNGIDTLPIAVNGSFTFATELTDSSDYEVTVSTQPTGQTCTVSDGSGVISAADVVSVVVNCVDDEVPTYSVGGNVNGLTGTGLELQNNGAGTLAIAIDGPFTFLTELLDTTAYAVTVFTQPSGQTCNVTGGSGLIAASDVTGVAVDCIDEPAPVPTLSQWALIMLSMFLGLMVFASRRRLF